MSPKDLDTDEVAEIYDELLKTYQKEWEYRGHKSLHLAYYDEDHQEPGEAAMNTMRILSDAADITSSDRILNIGCGAGEDSVWNARRYDVPVIGVNISEAQLEHARENARDHGVEELTTFNYDDFQELSTIEDDSITLVWGLEALSHSPDRRKALEAARRVLTDDGRVAVTDLFLRVSRESLTEKGLDRIETINDSLGVRIGYIGAFEKQLQEAGFEAIDITDLTDGIRESTRRRKKFASVANPVGKALGAVGVGSQKHLDALNANASIHELVDADVLGYFMITAKA